MRKRFLQKPTIQDSNEIVNAQVIDYDPLHDPNRSLASSLMPCAACGTPRQVGSRFCVSCGVPFETPNQNRDDDPRKRTTDPSFNSKVKTQENISPLDNVSIENQRFDHSGSTKTFRCDNCGSEVDSPNDQRSLRCPFCDSTYVVELSQELRTSQRPEFIIGFEVTRDKAQEMFFQWIGKNSFFRPGDLVRKAATEKQQGIYIPFWHFSMITRSEWSAQIGEYWYRTETYTVKNSDGKSEVRTRTVQETEWWPLSGIYRKYYSGYMVSASKGLPQEEALAIQPYKLNTMMRYRPMYLAGWMSEEYSVSKEIALATTQQEFRNRERNAISRFLPGDTQSGLTVQTDLDVGGSDLILLPIHVLSYRYGDKVYRFLVNGQTGKMVGEKPWSGSRIAAAVIAAILLTLIFIGLVIVLNQPGFGE
ncbi:MAG TPA: zinc ribbon domain-containing protein [Pirellula sp.]|nr:zinc ribbon domain-containing protein [Pirellula sp.]